MKKVWMKATAAFLAFTMLTACSSEKTETKAQDSNKIPQAVQEIKEEQKQETSVEVPPTEREETAIASQYSWWDGQWYGWWCIKDGSGAYETFNDIAWDAYAEISVNADDSGTFILWDTETSKSTPLASCSVTFGESLGEKGAMTSVSGTFYESSWLPNVVTVTPKPIIEYEWQIAPEFSTVSHFDDMLEIFGVYVDPNNENNSMSYYIYLRPWGTDWSDVKNGDTSGCIYENMMPVLYDSWYLPLMDLGVTELPENIDAGFALIEGGGNSSSTAASSVPGDKATADGKVASFDAAKAGLEWCKHERTYDSTYDEIAAQFGVHGKYIDTWESSGKKYCRYRWFADDNNYVTITFEIQANGVETWNITAWEGLK